MSTTPSVRYFQAQVQAGIRQLDRTGGADWRWRSKLDQPFIGSDFQSMHRCVLGRVFGNNPTYMSGYSFGMRTLGLEPDLLHAPAFGFAPGDQAVLDLGPDAYPELAREWNLQLGLGS